MSSYGDIIQRFHTALPAVRRWIDDFIDKHADRARAVGTLGFVRLSVCFPQELLESAKVVSVPHVPFPPVDTFGLPELAYMQHMASSGITFKDTFFLRQGHESESLHFHELVHVVQWARLGADNFLLAYGFGLYRFGYEESPLEHMAYSLQRGFKQGAAPKDLVRIIEDRTDAIWRQVAPILSKKRCGARRASYKVERDK